MPVMKEGSDEAGGGDEAEAGDEVWGGDEAGGGDEAEDGFVGGMKASEGGADGAVLPRWVSAAPVGHWGVEAVGAGLRVVVGGVAVTGTGDGDVGGAAGTDVAGGSGVCDRVADMLPDCISARRSFQARALMMSSFFIPCSSKGGRGPANCACEAVSTGRCVWAGHLIQGAAVSCACKV